MKARFLLPMALLAPSLAFAGDSGSVRVAYLYNPLGVGDVADTSYELTWLDSNMPAVGLNVTIDFYYTATMPPTFAIGEVPATLTGTIVATGIDEPSLENSLVWDTTAVPPGNYYLWTLARLDPRPATHLDVIAWSPGIVSIVHPGDELQPAVVLIKPNSPIERADRSFAITYAALDPDGTGRVKIEATLSRDATGFTTLARDLPAEANGMYTWDTSTVAEGGWTLRATIEDARGRSFTSYGRYFLTIDHPDPIADSGVIAPAPDAGVPGPNEDESGGCSCSNGPRGRDKTPLLFLFAAALAVVRWQARRPRVT